MPDPATLRAEAESYARRMLQELLTEALPFTWLRRAEAFESARSRPGDFHGRATAAEISARDSQLAQDALNCRHLAALLTEPGHPLTDMIRSDVAQIMGVTS